METKGRIGKTIAIQGEISADEDIQIEGKVEGKISVSRNLVISSTGVINAQVRARRVMLNGKLMGDITASDRVEIGRSASFEGNLASPRLSIADGAYFKGNVDMTGQEREDKQQRKSPVSPETADTQTGQKKS